MIWNPDFESLEHGALCRLQGERLGKLVDVLYRRVPFYRKKMDAAGVKPSDIQGVGDHVPSGRHSAGDVLKLECGARHPLTLPSISAAIDRTVTSTSTASGTRRVRASALGIVPSYPRDVIAA